MNAKGRQGPFEPTETPGLGPRHGAQWQAPDMAKAYAHRPGYPDETLDVLREITPSASRVLDVGCGTGDLTIGLTRVAGQVDALDPSGAMLAQARARPGADAIGWIQGTVSRLDRTRRYDLITAAECVHWMDWREAFPRLHALLEPDGYFVALERRQAPLPWDPPLRALIQRVSSNDEFVPYDALGGLAAHPQFECLGQRTTSAATMRQTVSSHIEAIHSRNGFSRASLAADDAQAFGSAYRALVEAHVHDNAVEVEVRAHLVWAASDSNHPTEAVVLPVGPCESDAASRLPSYLAARRVLLARPTRTSDDGTKAGPCSSFEPIFAQSCSWP